MAFDTHIPTTIRFGDALRHYVRVIQLKPTGEIVAERLQLVDGHFPRIRIAPHHAARVYDSVKPGDFVEIDIMPRREGGVAASRASLLKPVEAGPNFGKLRPAHKMAA